MSRLVLSRRLLPSRTSAGHQNHLYVVAFLCYTLRRYANLFIIIIIIIIKYQIVVFLLQLS